MLWKVENVYIINNSFFVLTVFFLLNNLVKIDVLLVIWIKF